MTNEPKAVRLPLMVTQSEAKAIDDWRFENRIPARADAIRQLIERGLKFSSTQSSAAESAPECRQSTLPEILVPIWEDHRESIDESGTERLGEFTAECVLGAIPPDIGLPILIENENDVFTDLVTWLGGRPYLEKLNDWMQKRGKKRGGGYYTVPAPPSPAVPNA